jgi:hypothetical protein
VTLVSHIVDFIGLKLVGNLTPTGHVAEISGLVKCYPESLGTKFLEFRRFVFGIFLTNRSTIKLSTINLSIALISYLVTHVLHIMISPFIS